MVRGFKALDLLIVVAATSLCLILGIPTHANYAVRSKVSEALAVAHEAKTAITITCTEAPRNTSLNKHLAGYTFHPSAYVKSVTFNGPCLSPVIVVLTANTGAPTDPTLTITGDFSVNARNISWICESDGLEAHLPAACRN